MISVPFRMLTVWQDRLYLTRSKAYPGGVLRNNKIVYTNIAKILGMIDQPDIQLSNIPYFQPLAELYPTPQWSSGVVCSCLKHLHTPFYCISLKQLWGGGIAVFSFYCR